MFGRKKGEWFWKFRRFAFRWEGEFMWEEGVESLGREGIKSDAHFLLKGLAFFGEPFWDLCGVEKKWEKKKERGNWKAMSFFIFHFLVDRKLGKKSKDREFQWKWHGHWTLYHLISRTAFFSQKRLECK